MIRRLIAGFLLSRFFFSGRLFTIPFRLLQNIASKLMPALIPLPPQTSRSSSRPLWRRSLRRQLKQHQTPGITNPIIAQLDDPRIPAAAVGEQRRDVVEQFLDDSLPCELLLLIDEPPI